MSVEHSSSQGLSRPRIAIAVSAVVLSLAALWWFLGRETTRTPSMDGSHPSNEVVPTPPSLSMAGSEGPRESALPHPGDERPVPSEAPSLPTRTPSTRAHGTVVDLKGAPVAGVGVAIEGDPSARILAWSDGRGEFQCELSSELSSKDPVLVAGDRQHATVRGCVATKSAEAEACLIIVAPAIAIEGRVIDEQHQGIGDAWLWIDLPADALIAVGRPLDSTKHDIQLTHSSADGSFHFDSVPAIEGAFLGADHARYTTAKVPLPPLSATNLEIVMHAPQDSTPHLDGIVLFADGRPAVDAIVSLGSQSTHTDAIGSFRLELGWLKDTTPLTAMKPGFQPAVVRGFGKVVSETNKHPPPARLVLGGPVLQIEGRVVRSGGEPCPGFHVWIEDGLEISQGLVPPAFAEYLSASTDGGKSITDGSGAFRLDGLASRDYRLQAWDPESLVMVESDPIAAGRTDVLLTVPANAQRERVRGRVLSTAGAPMPNVRVLVCLITVETDVGSDWIEGQSAITDGAGSFELSSVARHRLRLQVTAPDIMPLDRTIKDDEPTDDLSIVVLQRCHLRIEPGASESPAEALTALDSKGAQAKLWTLAANQWSGTTYVKLAAGRSEVLSMGEGSYTLVLHRGGKEMKRIPVSLLPGDVRVIQP